MSRPKATSKKSVNLLDKWDKEYLVEFGEPLDVGSANWLSIANKDVASIVQKYFAKIGRFSESCTENELVSNTWRQIAKYLEPNSDNKRSLLTESFIRQSASYRLREYLRQPFVKSRVTADKVPNSSEAGLSDFLSNMVADPMRTPSRVMIAEEESEQMCNLLVTILNENDLLLVVLRNFMDYSFKEIAPLFDRSEHSLRSRYSQILTILRPEFAKKFPTKFATVQRLGNEPAIDSGIKEFVVAVGKRALECQWDKVHACLARWLQDQLQPCDVHEFFSSAYSATLAENGIAGEHFPEGCEPEIGGSAFVTADNLRQPITWLGNRTRDISEEVTDENMVFWARLTLLGSPAQSEQLQLHTFAEIWMAVVNTDDGLRIGYWSPNAYEVRPSNEADNMALGL